MHVDYGREKKKNKNVTASKKYTSNLTLCVCVRGSCQDCDFQRKRENKTTKKNKKQK